MNTAYRDYGYGSWARKQERKAKLKRFFLVAVVLALFFAGGMVTQYGRDSEIRNMASDCMKRDLSKIENSYPKHSDMPKPTDAQISEARRHVKKFSTMKGGNP